MRCFIERVCIEFIYCQYTPAGWRVISNTLPFWKKMAIHCLQSGWIGKHAPLGNLHLLALEIATGGVFSHTSLLWAMYYNNKSHLGFQDLYIMGHVQFHWIPMEIRSWRFGFGGWWHCHGKCSQRIDAVPEKSCQSQNHKNWESKKS